jgi:hypothetical protein
VIDPAVARALPADRRPAGTGIPLLGDRRRSPRRPTSPPTSDPLATSSSPSWDCRPR